MKNDLSSLIDGELDEASQQTLLLALREDSALRAAWSEYQLIGDAIRRTPHLEIDLTARIISELAHEPTVLAPATQASRLQSRQAESESAASRWIQGAMRVAAAVSGVAVVGWLALNTPSATDEKPTLASRSPAIQLASSAPTPPRDEAADQAEHMQPYLMAHQTYSPGNRFDGGAGYVRTVASAR